MGIHFHNFCCVSTLALIGHLACPGFGSGQDLDPRLEKVRADWKKRREAIKTVRYTVDGKMTTYKAAIDAAPTAAGLAPIKEDVSQPAAEYTLLLDFVNNKHRLQEHDVAIGPENSSSNMIRTRVGD